jgi:hypothetical protein
MGPLSQRFMFALLLGYLLFLLLCTPPKVAISLTYGDGASRRTHLSYGSRAFRFGTLPEGRSP